MAAPQSRPPTEAEERLSDALASLRLAEAREAVAKAGIAEIQLAEARDEEKARLASDQFHHLYTLAAPITEASVRACMLRLSDWDRTDPECEMEIVFNSPGGSVVDGMALFDFILMMRSRGHQVTTTALGMAASMAGILLQAGDRRVMGSEAWLMIHEASFGAMGKMGDIEDTVDWVKRVQKRILQIFASRSKLSVAQLSTRWRRKNWWLDADEALKLGLIDEIRGL